MPRRTGSPGAGQTDRSRTGPRFVPELKGDGRREGHVLRQHDLVAADAQHEALIVGADGVVALLLHQMPKRQRAELGLFDQYLLVIAVNGGVGLEHVDQRGREVVQLLADLGPGVPLVRHEAVGRIRAAQRGQQQHRREDTDDPAPSGVFHGLSQPSCVCGRAGNG